LHLPFLKYMMHNNVDFKLIPIIVGDLSSNFEEEVGKLLAQYLDDDTNLIVVSSDFCHWGDNFQ